MQINLADFAIATNVLGPGRRAIVWVQGCPRSCPSCITPHMQPFGVRRELIAPGDLASRVLSHMPLDGITFVGGEPFSHARELAALVDTLRSEVDVGVVTYTGHTLEQIQRVRSADWEALLAVTDLLIDGEYLEERACDLLWRGSENQTLHFLSNRYAPLAPYVRSARGRLLEIALNNRGELRIIGIPDKAFFETLACQLADQGVDLTFITPS
jgi:anaerobic ribonucleoside-triphosphate reductase activating protein